MPGPSHQLIVIGENINTTRKVRATSPNIVQEDGKVGYAYTGLDGARRYFRRIERNATIPQYTVEIRYRPARTPAHQYGTYQATDEDYEESSGQKPGEWVMD